MGRYLSLLLLPTIAISQIVPTQSGRGCSGFPNWQPTPDDVTGAFWIRAYAPNIPQLHNLKADVVDERLNDFIGNRSTVGNIIAPVWKPDQASNVYACRQSKLYEMPSGTTAITIKRGEAGLLVSEAGLPVETYNVAVNGTQLSGTFLGSANRTRWAFKFERGPGGPSSFDWYELRLLPHNLLTEPVALHPREVFGFLRAEAA